MTAPIYRKEKLEQAPTDVAELASDESTSNEIWNALVTEDHQHEIQLRTMSWQKAAWLLAGDQVCLAIMAQSWSLSVLGWVPGIITMVVSGALFWVTSLTMHKYIMKHPQIRNICDFGYYVFGKSQTAYIFSGFMLLANNILLIGFHILTGAKVLDTLSDHSLCTVTFSAIVMVMGIVLSAPRTLRHVSFMSMFSAACMGLAILLFLIFAGIETAPLDFPTDGPVRTYAFPLPGTSWVDCMNAVLNITFLWVPQILFPTFIAEMEHPEDFPKSLAVLAIISTVLFIVPPAIGFRYLGQYATAPAFGSLGLVKYRKASFGFVIVPTLIIGAIYANVTAKFIYSHLLGTSRHAHSNTVVGWGVWALVMIGIWVLGFIFSEVVPSMGDFLSLLGAAFDSFFGFIFFAVAYWHLYRGKLFAGLGRTSMTLLHAFVMACGLFLLGPGLYAAVEAIITDYSGSVSPAFSCASLGI
ncbi:transmembrane amino acid transporter protein-domain-containing protein [Aspergillus welwitschiae]|uniref:Transmembrane amino acid transporter protein-domain-containing protein n=1 Tax=Aspergillus welwitschiae TaxID=1341132 RepID=A0A3F3Q679_9EURO|nr:transmembrane amino acid transporter protein-domain-containing protein [Aspergillus welwitschiae]RDH34673.1 transmembrane amino acid transporter protein-domain-containing protein [Aspergillus welwitschiae]